MDKKLVEDKDKTGTGEVLRLGQQTKIKTKTASNISHGPSGCRALAGKSDKYRLQHSQMNIIA